MIQGGMVRYDLARGILDEVKKQRTLEEAISILDEGLKMAVGGMHG